MSSLCQIFVVLLLLSHAGSSTCSAPHYTSMSLSRLQVCWHCITKQHGLPSGETQPGLLWLSTHDRGKCAGGYLARVWGILRISERRTLALQSYSLAPFLQSPTHVRLKRASSLWTCESFVLHTGLSLPLSCLSVNLRSGRDRRLRPYPFGLILSAGALPILRFSSCRRCAKSCTVQVPSEQPCLLDWLLEILDLFVRTMLPELE